MTMRMKARSQTEVAKMLGVSGNTVGRAARRAGVGVYDHTGKLLCLLDGQLGALKSEIRGEVGNPNWIATRGTGPHSRFKPPC